MCMYIGIEDLVANALIELVEKSSRQKVSFRELNQYGATVIQILIEGSKKAVLIMSNEKTCEFLQDYSDFFEYYSNETEDGIKLKGNVTIDQLWEKFRGYLSVDVMQAFMDNRSISALGIGA